MTLSINFPAIAGLDDQDDKLAVIQTTKNANMVGSYNFCYTCVASQLEHKICYAISNDTNHLHTKSRNGQHGYFD